MTLKNITDFMSLMVSAMAVLTSISATIWFFVDDEIGEKLARLTGTAELAQIAAEIENRLTEIETRVAAIEPAERVAVYDTLRSLVWDDCPTEGVCSYTWRVRRTPEGVECQAPSVRHFVVDRFGVTHPVTPAPGHQVARASAEWTEISGSFNLPETVPAGVAEFYMDVVYEGCFPDEPLTKVRERTPTLVFYAQS